MLEFQFFLRKRRTHGLLAALAFTVDYLLQPILRVLWRHPVRKTFSQRGEDLLMDRILGMPGTGFYVDVGANHPRKLSNTKRFYDRGWRGCNVEPDPRLHRAFELSRPQDINLRIGLAQETGWLAFFRFEPDVFSTFSPERAEQLRRSGVRQVEMLEVEVETLDGLFRKHIRGRTVDFLSVDTEGLDLFVLKGNDWKEFRPKVICVEAPGQDDPPTHADSTRMFLESVGYARRAVTQQYGVPLNEIYVDSCFKSSCADPAIPEG